MWVPVSRSVSRMRCTRRRRGSTSASCFSPLIVTLTSIVSAPLLRALDRPPQRAAGQHSHEVLLVLDGAAQVLAGLGRFRRQLRHLLDRRVVGPLALERGLGLRGLDGYGAHVGEA